MATKRVDVRFEPELWREVELFMRASRTELACDAVRMLTEIGVSRVNTLEESYQLALRRSLKREMARELRAQLDKTLGGEGPRE